MATSGVNAKVQFESLDWYEVVEFADRFIEDLVSAANTYEKVVHRLDLRKAREAKSLADALEAACAWNDGAPSVSEIGMLLQRSREVLAEFTHHGQLHQSHRPTVPVLYDVTDEDEITAPGLVKSEVLRWMKSRPSQHADAGQEIDADLPVATSCREAYAIVRTGSSAALRRPGF
jgi:hypothetical protein